MENSIYTVDYYLTKFRAIPEDKFCVNTFRTPDRSQRCFAGHCMPDKLIETVWADPSWKIPQHECDYGMAAELFRLCKLFHVSATEGQNYVYDINNGKDPRYQQPTVKARILAALEDIKKLQQPAPEPKAPEVKVIYRTVLIDSTVKELSGQLTNN